MAGTSIVVPERLTRPHPFVTATREAAKGIKPHDDGRVALPHRPGVISCRVSRDQLPRCLRIAHAVFTAATAAGWKVVRHDNGAASTLTGVGIDVRGHVYPQKIVELTTPVPFTDADLAVWQKRYAMSFYADKRANPPRTKPRANGSLKLSFPVEIWHEGGHSNWADGSTARLETKLDTILPALVARADADHERDRRFAENRAQAERERQTLEERVQQERIEQARGARLQAEAAAWRRTSELRPYVEALRAQLPAMDAEDQAVVGAWVDWADSWHERPTRSGAQRSCSDSMSKPTSGGALGEVHRALDARIEGADDAASGSFAPLSRLGPGHAPPHCSGDRLGVGDPQLVLTGRSDCL